jgi:hypothetical protein
MGMEVCTTLGMLTPEQAAQLREAGLTAYNHNLDTSPEYYGKVRGEAAGEGGREGSGLPPLLPLLDALRLQAAAAGLCRVRRSTAAGWLSSSCASPPSQVRHIPAAPPAPACSR